MFGKLTKSYVLPAIMAATSFGIFACSATQATASTIPSNAYYGDTFPSPGTRGGDLEGDTPEINATGGSAIYDGWGNHSEEFKVTTTAIANTVNDGSSGVLAVAQQSNDFTIAVPVPSRKFSVQVDVVPFSGSSIDSNRNAGFILISDVNKNYFNGDGAIRVGIGGKTNDILRAQQNQGTGYTTQTSTLSQFAADNWNHLRADVDLDAQTITVFLNHNKVATYTFPGINSATYIGLDSASGKNADGITVDRTVYFDNFSVSPLPEPGSVTMFGLGALAMLGHRRRR